MKQLTLTIRLLPAFLLEGINGNILVFWMLRIFKVTPFAPALIYRVVFAVPRGLSTQNVECPVFLSLDRQPTFYRKSS